MAKEISFDDFSKYLEKTLPAVKENLEKKIKLCCQKVKSDIQHSMADTPRDMSKTYYSNNKTKAHNPSLPGNPPAPDTGNLRKSIRYELNSEGDVIYGIVGTTQKDPPYGAYLENAEYGSSKMAPRPWLRPAMERNNEFIRMSIAKGVMNGIKLKGVKK